MSDSNVSQTATSYERIPVVCLVDDLKTEGFVLRRDLSKGERVQRALKIFGICFGVAFLTIFIPILHFILPPLFLILGGIFATTTFMETAMLGGGEVTCPNCKKVMTIRKEAEEWPKTLRCEGCSFTLTVKRA